MDNSKKLSELLRERENKGREERERNRNGNYLDINEETWHKLLEAYPQIIETGLTFIQHEEKVENGFIDLHFKDINGKDLIVEVKRIAKNKTVIQILKYGISYPEARLMVVAEEFRDDFQEIIDIISKYTHYNLKIECMKLIKL